jgi:uracil-DNA glycosylase family 4
MSDLLGVIPTIPGSVPNVFPTHPAAYRLAIIGEAPGREELATGQLFVGGAGRLLDSILSNVGISRQACYLGNICQVQPPANDIHNFAWDSPQIQTGLDQLSHDLTLFKPNLCLLLGSTALRAARGLEEVRQKRTTKHVPPSVSSWRGSLFICDVKNSPFFGLKCLCSFHPAYILRVYESLAVFRFDVRRAKEESFYSDLVVPQRTIKTTLSVAEVIFELRQISVHKPTVAFDLEGYPWAMTCCSLATSPDYCLVIDFTTLSVDDELAILVELSRVLSDSSISKTLQNSLYDNFVLAFTYNIPILGIVDDTMLGAWESFNEMEKSLGFLASIYTREPYWKDKRNHEDKAERLVYNGKDSCVTYEINVALRKQLVGRPLDHYQFNINLLSPLLYMEMRGLRWNKDLASDARKAQETKRSELQASLPVPVLNVESPKQMKEYLYDTLGLPIQYARPKNDLPPAPTCDALALLKLFRLTENPVLKTILKIRACNSLVETLAIATDFDGRIRCGYNVVGTDTGRLSCYESPTGSGMNLQTVTKKLRYLVEADPDHYLFQCDLAGADGWTVACECKLCGDSTMYDDYMFGLKPARLVALMYEGIDVASKSRAELKLLSKSVSSDSWLYFTCKRIQHATNYGTTPKTIVEQVIKDSYKLYGDPIFITEEVAAKLQRLYLARYRGVPKQQEYIISQLKTRGFIDCVSGARHKFFGRRDSHDTHKAAFSVHPQNTTTYVTNLAAWRLWSDQANRNGSALRVEPLHQVHDALVGQFRSDDCDRARSAITQYFNNPVTIAGTTIVIPFEGKYGATWDETPGDHEPTLKTL